MIPISDDERNARLAALIGDIREARRVERLVVAGLPHPGNLAETRERATRAWKELINASSRAIAEFTRSNPSHSFTDRVTGENL